MWGGVLSIAPNIFNGKWTPMEEEIARIQTELGENIIDENVEKEKSLSETNDDEKYPFLCFNPCGMEQPWVGKVIRLGFRSSHHGRE